MSVYVDDMYADFGRMKMCHMVADTHDELVEMAIKIGVQLKWIQHAGQVGEHFDIAMSKRAAAVYHGAIEVTWGDVGKREWHNRHNKEEFMRKYYGMESSVEKGLSTEEEKET